MSDNSAGATFIELTAQIVSAYVGNNSVPAPDLSALISQVHSALSRVSSGQSELARAAQARDFGQEVDHARPHRLSGRRQEIQVAQAPSAHAIPHDARAIPRQMGACRRIIRWWRQLRRGPLAACQADGPRPAAPAPQVAPPVKPKISAIAIRPHRAGPFRRIPDGAVELSALDDGSNSYRNLSLSESHVQAA